MGQQQQPITEDKKLVTLGRVLQTLREEDNVDVLLETTVNYLQTEFNYSLVWIGFYDRLDHRILGKGGITPTGDVSFLKTRIFLNPGDLLEQVVIQLRPIGVPDLQKETRAGEWRKAAANFNIRGTLIFPIRYRDRCFGVVLMGTAGWGVSPRPEEKARLSMLLGTLGASLNQIEADWNRQRTKRPDEPMFRILEQLRERASSWQRMEAIVSETHQFITPTRTNIYWFEQERRYFWRRVSNRQVGIGDGSAVASGITVQESGGFYNALIGDQIVSIGEAHSSLKADITSRLLQRLGVRSLLAAPIRLGDELLGFLSVEGSEPRIWKEEEKNFVRGAAQLIALISPIEQMEATIEQTKQDQLLTSEITSAITSEEDWQKTLKVCTEQLTGRLQIDRLLVLLFDPDQKQFEVCYQHHPVNRRPLSQSVIKDGSGHPATHVLPNLTQVDWLLLERSKEPVGIEDLSNDLKLLVWRNLFLEAGVRSVLTCNTTLGRPLTGLLLVSCENARTWTATEREIFRIVSQQIGLILNQWRLNKECAKQQKNYQSLQWAFSTMQQAQTVSQIEAAALGAIASMVQAPMAALVTWSPGSKEGQILTTPITNPKFAIDAEFTVPVHTDELIQEILFTDGLLIKNAETLPTATRRWLCGEGIGEVLAIALRTTPDHAPTGIALFVKGAGEPWQESILPMFGLLISQFAWSRRFMMLIASLQQERQELQCLNWYKHRLIEDFYLKNKGISKDLGNGQSSSTLNGLSSISQMLAREQWKTKIKGSEKLAIQEKEVTVKTEDSVRLASLLRRSLERIDGLIKQRRIWTQLHDAGGENALTSSLCKSLDVVKIELVLYEVLLSACDRCANGGRIDIWYRPFKKDNAIISGNLTNLSPVDFYPSSFIELSITDNGTIDPQLITDLQQVPLDELAPSTLDKPPGLHLRICQLLLRPMGCELSLYQMDDGRIVSRLIVPLDN
ncbi:MAG TPA: GAF domain-containing protein [Leptolyngbyaceae cyanobacterium]